MLHHWAGDTVLVMIDIVSFDSRPCVAFLDPSKEIFSKLDNQFRRAPLQDFVLSGLSGLRGFFISFIIFCDFGNNLFLSWDSEKFWFNKTLNF